MVLNKNLARLTGLLVVSSMALAACGGATEEKPGGQTPATPAADGKPAAGGELVLRLVSDPDTYAYFWRTSAYAADVIDRVYGGGLMGVGMDYKPTPAMAEAAPEVSADGKTYTFKIKKGIKFHDGKEVTAEDFKFTYDILMSPEYTGPFKSAVSEIASVEVVDTHGLKITTKDIFAPFLFSSASLPPMPKHLLGTIAVKDMQAADFWSKTPVGAGPYKFVEAVPGQYVVLERFAEYYNANKPGDQGGTDGPWIQKLRFKVVPEENTAVAGLEAGELSLLQSVEPQDAARFRQDFTEQLNVYEWNRMGYGYQTFNNDKFPTNIKEVRQALSHGLNREGIVQGILNGEGVVPPGFVPPIHWAFDSSIKGYEYSKEKAIALMEKAGFKKNANGIFEKDGQPAKLKYVATKGSATVEGIALQSQKDWKEIGVETEILAVDFNTLLDKHMKPGDFHVTFSGLNFTLDPHTSFSGFHSNSIRLDDKGNAQGSNRSRYSNPKVDELIDKGMKTVDIAERTKIYHEAQKLIVDDAANNWVYVNVWTDAVDKKVKGVVNLDGFGTDLGWVSQWFITDKAN